MKKLLLIAFMVLAANSFGAIQQFNSIPTVDFNLSVSRDKINRVRVITGFFKSTNLSATRKTVWNGTGNYVFPTSAVIMSVASTNANDTALGTGARKVNVVCLDENYEQFQEEVTLNGQTPVAMSSACLRIQGGGVMVTEAGSNGYNEGTVNIGTGAFAAGVPANLYNLVIAQENTSTSGFYTVPAGETAYFYKIEASSVSNKPLEFWTVKREFGGVAAFTQFLGFFLDGFVDSRPIHPIKFEEKTDLMALGKMESGTGAAKAYANILLVKE